MRALLITIMFATAAVAAPGGEEAVLSAQARRLQDSILVVDTHVDIPLNYAGTDKSDPGELASGLKASLDSMECGGYGCVFLIAYTPQGPRGAQETAAARKKFTEDRLDGIDRMLDKYPLRVVKALSTDDAVSAHERGLRAVAVGMENGYPLGTDLPLLKYFYNRGVRYITLTHNGNNDIGDSANPPGRAYPEAEPGDNSVRLLHDLYVAEDAAAGAPAGEHGGLSEFGRRVVAEMNRLGIMVDISHTAPSTVADVLEFSAAPVIASHSSCRALCDNRRNLTDDQLRAIAAHGGVVQITAVPDFVSSPAAKNESLRKLLADVGALDAGYDSLLALWQNDRTAYDKYSLPYLERVAAIDSLYPPPCLKDFVNHIDHAVQVAGIEHVGIGSDFDGGGAVAGFSSPADAPAVTAELLRRGYTEAAIGMIWGGNLMRVWRGVEAVSKEMAGK